MISPAKYFLKFKPVLAIPFLLLLLHCKVTLAQEFSSHQLPELGTPDAEYLSEQEALTIGNAFYMETLNSSSLIKDAQINLYLRTLVAKLHNVVPFSHNPIRILIIKNNELNAFALPGNIIVIHSELLLQSENESQLVGVLAHELAHLKQNHLMRLFASQQKSQGEMFIAILAALILSQDPQVSNAALSAGIASGIQGTLDYTRRQEYEADRIAVEILKKAKYDPTGMMEFFRRLFEQEGYNHKSSPNGEFLRTHPLSQNRVAEVADRITPLDSKSSIKNSDLFDLMKWRLAHLLNKKIPTTNNSLVRCYEQLINSSSVPQCTAPTNEKNLQLEIARASHEQNRKKSGSQFIALIKQYPESPEVYLSYLDFLHKEGDHTRFIQVALHFLKFGTPVFPDLYKQLSISYSFLGKSDEANYYLALFYQLTGRIQLSKLILKKAIKSDTLNTIQNERITNLLNKLEQEIIRTNKS